MTRFAVLWDKVRTKKLEALTIALAVLAIF